MREVFRNKDRKKGFTLVEVIVVLVILGILMAILIPSLTGYISKTKTRTCELRRSSMQRYFKAAYAGEDSLRECKDIIELQHAAGGDILAYMVDNGYCEEEEIWCPVYREKYQVDFWVEGDGKVNIDFICPCNSENVKGYIASALEQFNSKDYNAGGGDHRANLIKDFYDQRGSLLKVSSQFTSGTSFAGKELYWRPYFLSDGTMVLYAAGSNDSTNAQWKADLVYVNGTIYQSTFVNNKGQNEGTSVAWMYAGKDYGTLESMITEKNFAKVTK